MALCTTPSELGEPSPRLHRIEQLKSAQTIRQRRKQERSVGGLSTYRCVREVSNPISDGMAPLSSLLDKSLQQHDKGSREDVGEMVQGAIS